MRACAGISLVVLAASAARAAPVVTAPDPLTSTGTTVVAKPVAVVFAALADPSAWPRLLSDVERVVRVPGVPGEWRVASRLLGHSHVLELKLEPDRLVHFHVTDPGPGGALVVDINFEPRAGGSTQVRYTMRTVLPFGLDRVFDDDLIRKAREKKIYSDLADLERAFGVTPPADR